MLTKNGSSYFVKTVALLFTCFSEIHYTAQQASEDSVLKIIRAGKKDSNEVNAINSLAWIKIGVSDYDTVLALSARSLSLADSIKFLAGKAESYNIIGIVNNIRGYYPTALENFINALRINEAIHHETGTARSLMYIGLVHMFQKNYPKALDYIIRAYEINKKTGNKKVLANNLINLALVYRNQKNHELSIKYYQEAYALNKELNNERSFANILMSLGLNYSDLSHDTIQVADKQKRKEYMLMAKKYHEDALIIQEQSGDQYGIAINKCSLANIYSSLGDFDLAEKTIIEALELSREMGLIQNEASSELNYVTILHSKKDYKNALTHFQIYDDLRDTIFSEEKQNALVEKEMQFEFEKKEARAQALAEAEKDKIRSIAAEEKKQQQLISAGVGILLFLTALFAVFIFNRFRVTRKQKLIIEKQKTEVETRNREIGESIEYARYLQNAILPPKNFLKEHFADSFLLYLPKDIVAGDFYWMETIDSTGQTNDPVKPRYIFLAAADSTGHGIPGAMVSVICGNALNRAVLEFGLREPGKILDKATEIVVNTFARSDKKVMDGMDISLLAFDTVTNTVSWAGANNDLWIYDPKKGIILDMNADKQPVGRSDRNKSFTTHIIPDAADCSFYLFTDGYADQFGGPKGKKFMLRRLKELITEIASLPMNHQRDMLKESFTDWKSTQEQVDDVCLIGISLRKNV